MLAKLDKRMELATGLEMKGSVQGEGPTWKGESWELSAYVPGGHVLPHLDGLYSTFSFGYFRNPVFWPNLKKIAPKTRSKKYPKEKVKKLKMLKMLLFIICEAPPKNSTFLKPFLAIFTLFHLKNWPYLQKPEFGNLAKTRF